MKITIDIPNRTLAVTFQYVYDDDDLNMKIKQYVLDTNALNKIREAEKNG